MKKENYFGVALFIVITLQIFSNNKKNFSILESKCQDAVSIGAKNMT